MKIKGIQNLTLIDYPGKIACTIFLFGCNFRCGFCHNPELVLKDTIKEISETEIFNFLSKRKEHLDGVCITGGEPLMTLDEHFVRRIKIWGYSIKIDTNGSFPEKLKQLIDKKLIDFVAMDIKTCREKYSEVVGINVDLNKIEESIKLISNMKDYEFRTTIVEGLHSIEDIKKMSVWLNELCGKKPKKFSLQGFKNQGKLIDESFKKRPDTSDKFLDELKENIKDYFEEVEIKT